MKFKEMSFNVKESFSLFLGLGLLVVNEKLQVVLKL